MKQVCKFILLFSCISIVYSCETEYLPIKSTWVWTLPSSFDSLPPQPSDNLLDSSRFALGQLLFNDTRLSGDGQIACSSCHKATLAFADTVSTSMGVHGRKDRRNSPSLLNVAYQRALFMEGGVPTLELQVLAPFGNANEMDFTLTAASELLRKDDIINQLAQKSYGKDIDNQVISRALAAYQRGLISSGNAWDRFTAGDSTALNAGEKRGMAIFFSAEAACANCHSGFLFTDQGFHNIGLYSDYPDEGRSRLTMQDSDIGKFKTPGLRNVALTPPYMHDGGLASLEDVVEFKNSGGLMHPNKSAYAKPLNLSQAQKEELIMFLRSLTDNNFSYQPIQENSRYP